MDGSEFDGDLIKRGEGGYERARREAVWNGRMPERMPDVIVGFCGSNGMPFLLQVMCARSSAFSLTLPVRFFGRRSTSARCVSVPPETISKPRDFSVSDSALALATTFCA